ncbi:MAG: DUF488 domain-containing protein [Anaerolineales bacterium]|nr:DUF488 family protein [Anaerolineae bacterium]PWB54654.1 MAG: DUF488 domain-containing protein [Anaerolineales bacterium]
MIRIKRVYTPAKTEDGPRFLVDRLWPRGIKKENLVIQAWFKQVAPSNELRQWYGHDPDKWCEFNERYFKELDDHPETWQPLLEAARMGDITLLFSTTELERNNAVSLRAYLEKQLKSVK